MNIWLHAIPHEQQRYRTLGDWLLKPNGAMTVLVSDTGNPDYNFLLAIHEMVEAYLCLKHGISQEQVDAYDMTHEDDPDPGDNPSAPYHAEHLAATGIEMVMAAYLGVSCSRYEKRLEEMDEKEKAVPR